MKYKLAGVPMEMFLKRFFFIAYQSSAVAGMGLFQARQGMTEEQVWQNIATAGDYSRNINSTPGDIYADYVFGSMMKLGVKYDTDTFEITSPREKPRVDYQSWAIIYRDMDSLIEETVTSLLPDAAAVAKLP